MWCHTFGATAGHPVGSWQQQDRSNANILTLLITNSLHHDQAASALPEKLYTAPWSGCMQLQCPVSLFWERCLDQTPRAPAGLL